MLFLLSAMVPGAVASQTLVSVADFHRVRSTDAAVLELFTEGAARSATFLRLVDAIGRSNGIVYVEWGYCAFGDLAGCVLPFLKSAQGDRYLRVLVSPDKNRRTHDQLLALIAHELQHAVEILDHAEVVDLTR